MPRLLALAACLLAAALAAALAAQEPAGPSFVLCGTGGPLPPAALRAVEPGWAVRLSTPDKSFAAGDWVCLRQDRRHRPAPPADHVVVLGSGDRLPFQSAAPVRLQAGRLALTPAEPLRPRAGAELSLFRPYVAVVLWALPEGADDAESFLARLRPEERSADVAYLRNGDRVEGTVTGLDADDGCTVRAEGETIRTPYAKLAAIAFASDRVSRPRPKKTHALAVLAGGARLHFTELRYDGAARRWAGRTTTGAEVTFAEADLVALELLRGPAVYLSELTPWRYEPVPYLGVRWPLGVDAAVDGRPLRLGGDWLDRGLGVHGPCRVSYALEGRFAWFEAVAGLDPTAGGKGRARLAVVIDDKEYPLAEGKERTAADAPLGVRLDVRGARRLTLVTEAGSLGDVQARVTWGEARLIKGG